MTNPQRNIRMSQHTTSQLDDLKQWLGEPNNNTVVSLAVERLWQEERITKMTKNFYAGHSYMGTNYTYNSPCWRVYAFSTRAARDKWVDENQYSDQGNIVAESIDYQTACQILPGIRRGDFDDVRFVADVELPADTPPVTMPPGYLTNRYIAK